jgi:AcrR family transcriptional regulator
MHIFVPDAGGADSRPVPRVPPNFLDVRSDTLSAVTTTDAVDAVETVDGRRERGDASRRAILDAACRIVADDGVGAVTHRRVARVAGVPPARVSYHFPTIEDLLVTAAHQYLQEFDDRLRAQTEAALVGEASIVEACTTVLHDLATTRAREFLAMVEVRLALTRRGRTVEDPGLVSAIRSFGADGRLARSIIAAMFGFAVLAASEPGEVSRADTEAHVRTILGQPA